METAEEDFVSDLEARVLKLYLYGGEALVHRMLEKQPEDPATLTSLGSLHVNADKNQSLILSLLRYKEIKKTKNHIVKERRCFDSREYVAHLTIKDVEFSAECQEQRFFFLPSSRNAVMRIKKARMVIEFSVRKDKVALEFIQTLSIEGIVVSDMRRTSIVGDLFKPSLVNAAQNFEKFSAQAMDFFFSKLFTRVLFRNALF